MSQKNVYLSREIMNSYRSIVNSLSVLILMRFKVYSAMFLAVICINLVLCGSIQAQKKEKTKIAKQSKIKIGNTWVPSSAIIRWINQRLCDKKGKGDALYLDLQIVINASHAGQFIDAAKDKDNGLKGHWSMSTATGGGKGEISMDEENKGKYKNEFKEREETIVDKNNFWNSALDEELDEYEYTESEGLFVNLEGRPDEEVVVATSLHGYSPQYIRELQNKSKSGNGELDITNEEAHEAAKAVTDQKLQAPQHYSSSPEARNRRIDGKMRKGKDKNGEDIPEAPDAESLHALILDQEYYKSTDCSVNKNNCMAGELFETLDNAGYFEKRESNVLVPEKSTISNLKKDLKLLGEQLRGKDKERIGKEKAFIWIYTEGGYNTKTIKFALQGELGVPGNGMRFQAPSESIVIEEDAAFVRYLEEETVRPDGSLLANDDNLHRSVDPYLTLATSSETFTGPTDVGIYANDIFVDTISFNNDPRGGVYTVSFSNEVLCELIPTLETDPNITIGFELPTAGDYFVLATDDDFWNDPNYPHDEFGIGIDVDLQYMPAEICLIADNFEDYNDLLGFRPFDIWRDGLVVVDPYTGEITPGNGTGAAVGHMWLPFMEVTTVHSGGQSLPVYINNTQTPFYSETTKALDTPLDFTTQGADTLSVSYYIDQTSNLTASDRVYIGIEDDKGNILTQSEEGAEIKTGSWQELNLDLSVVDDENFNLSSITKAYLGVGDRDNPQPGGTGLIYFDDILLLWEHLTAFNPYPADGATDISTKPVEFQWSAANIPGVSHNVYFGDNFDNVNDGSGNTFRGNQNETIFIVTDLKPSTSYYWRIEEVGYDDKVHKGPVWRFETTYYISVDDFEEYDDDIDTGTAIWQTWIAGLTNGTGSIVGYFEPPFAETTIVHGGAQSMPIGYDNTTEPYYSMIQAQIDEELAIGIGPYWSAEGFTDLSLWFCGRPENNPEALWVLLEDDNGTVGTVNHPDPYAALIDTWTEWVIPFERFADQDVELTNVNKIALGLGTRGSAVAGGSGKMYIDDVRLMRLGKKASNPKPVNGAEDISANTGFSWQPGQDAVQHDVYYGMYEGAVAIADTSDTTGVYRLRQGETSFNPGTLELGQTYYWRVDEVDADGDVTKGDLWTFTTATESGMWGEYFNLPVGENPVMSRIDDEIDFSWSSGGPGGGVPNNNSMVRWTGEFAVPVTGTYTIILKNDGAADLIVDGETLIDNYKYNGTSTGSADINLVAGQMYSIRLEWYHYDGNATCQLLWYGPGIPMQIIPASAFALPVRASEPNPPDGAVDVTQEPFLSWSAGCTATTHNIFLGPNKDEVSNASAEQQEQQAQRVFSNSSSDKGRQTVTANAASDVYKGRQTETTYSPGPLEWGKTYYWRVDAVEADGTIRKGHIWSFTTANFLHVDNFESYTDNVPGGETVFQTWFDGASNGTGSVVGYNFSANGTFGDTTVFYDGRQSMPLFYNNNQPGSLKYSETLRAFTPTLDLTVNGMDTLTLYVRGQTGNGVVPFYVGLQSGANRKNVTYGDQMIVRSTSWVEVNIPLADFTGVNAGAVNAIYIGLGNPDAPTPGGSGLIYIDAIRATKAVP
jgi:hypothetical protein